MQFSKSRAHFTKSRAGFLNEVGSIGDTDFTVLPGHTICNYFYCSQLISEGLTVEEVYEMVKTNTFSDSEDTYMTFYRKLVSIV